MIPPPGPQVWVQNTVLTGFSHSGSGLQKKCLSHLTCLGETPSARSVCPCSLGCHQRLFQSCVFLPPLAILGVDPSPAPPPASRRTAPCSNLPSACKISRVWLAMCPDQFSFFLFLKSLKKHLIPCASAKPINHQPNVVRQHLPSLPSLM